VAVVGAVKHKYLSELEEQAGKQDTTEVELSIVAAEPLTADDARRARSMMNAAFTRRTGQEVIPGIDGPAPAALNFTLTKKNGNGSVNKATGEILADWPQAED
jgi:hypothetical protein